MLGFSWHSWMMDALVIGYDSYSNSKVVSSFDTFYCLHFVKYSQNPCSGWMKIHSWSHKIDENQRQLIFLSFQSTFLWMCLIIAPNWDAISGNYTKMKSKPKPIALSDANEWKLVLNGAKFRFWFVNELMRTIKSQLWFIPSLP